MKGIFRGQKSGEEKRPANPPTSLVESYINLSLLADDEFAGSGKIGFEKYFTLFMQIKNLLHRNV